MTNTALLESVIAKRGIKKGKIAERLGISYPSLKRKIENMSDFTAGEILAMCDILNIDNLADREAIFFAARVDK